LGFLREIFWANFYAIDMAARANEALKARGVSDKVIALAFSDI
jgi:hypothetical protein